MRFSLDSMMDDPTQRISPEETKSREEETPDIDEQWQQNAQVLDLRNGEAVPTSIRRDTVARLRTIVRLTNDELISVDEWIQRNTHLLEDAELQERILNAIPLNQRRSKSNFEIHIERGQENIPIVKVRGTSESYYRKQIITSCIMQLGLHIELHNEMLVAPSERSL